MNVLLTDNTFSVPGGAESFLRDLARDLKSLGHSVVAFTNIPASESVALDVDDVPNCRELKTLPWVPDVIHAQHNMDAMTALVSFPNVPAIYHCHGAVWRDNIVKHPRIYRYLAMSRTLAQRIAIESNIPPNMIQVLLNGVDTGRFSEVRSLPERPVRALFYNKHHRYESETAQAVETAASASGIELDWIGRHFGKEITHPEQVLHDYDLVFASGMSALEAMASGCAVIVLGRTSCGEMVLPENFDQLRAVNFSIAVNSPPPCADKIKRQICRFSTGACAEVTRRIRTEADSRHSVEALLELYHAVIEQHAHREADVRGELLAVSRYLRGLVPLVKMADSRESSEKAEGFRTSMVNVLRGQIGSLIKQIGEPS